MTLKKRIRGSISLRLLIIGFLVLILLIPAGMISSLVHERKMYKEKAVFEVSSMWARAQTISGPVVTVPFEKTWRDEDGRTRAATDYLQFLPTRLEIEAELIPEIRPRGIFRVILYSAAVTMSGHFSFDGLEQLDVPTENVRWQDAFVSLLVPDMRGVKENIELNWDGGSHLFEPGVRKGNDIFESGVSALISVDPPAAPGRKYEFSCVLRLNGSEELSILPLGKTTVVDMRSPWPNPSFVGAFLPEDREVGEDGFTARWRVLDFNRNFPQQWAGAIGASRILSSGFGVRLFSPVDEYTKTSRAVKYAVMFIGLTFLLFFLVEVFTGRRIHPVQYLLVGLALSLFYLLLLSLSEHLGFTIAYLIAAGSVAALISSYVGSALGGRAPALATAGSLAGLYGFLYILLQNQDYALLIGSVGLFGVMAAVMYLSRKVDWYGLEAGRAKPAPDPPNGVATQTHAQDHDAPDA